MSTDEAETQGDARSSGLAGFLKRHLQACLRGDLQKGRSIRAANNSRNFSASPSVPSVVENFS
jgi:hypothetical protein